MGALDDAFAEISEWCSGRPEGTEDGRGGGYDIGFGGELVCDLIDQAVNRLVQLRMCLRCWRILTIQDRGYQRFAAPHFSLSR
jgi:hypothetical protein